MPMMLVNVSENIPLDHKLPSSLRICSVQSEAHDEHPKIFPIDRSGGVEATQDIYRIIRGHYARCRLAPPLILVVLRRFVRFNSPQQKDRRQVLSIFDCQRTRTTRLSHGYCVFSLV